MFKYHFNTLYYRRLVISLLIFRRASIKDNSEYTKYHCMLVVVIVLVIIIAVVVILVIAVFVVIVIAVVHVVIVVVMMIITMMIPGLQLEYLTVNTVRPASPSLCCCCCFFLADKVG